MIECSQCGKEPGVILFKEESENGEEAKVGKPVTLFCTGCAREAMYEKHCVEPSDINEHLPLLRALAAQSETVIEFGTRWARGSTVAFLAAQPKKLVAWDIDPEMILHQRVMDLWRLRGATSFEPRVGNTLEISPEPCDLLFFDTLHTYDQLLAELMRHSDPGGTPGSLTRRPVKKYLVFHDTSTFGRVGEDKKEPGIYRAIWHYQKNEAFPLWEVMPLSEVKGLSAKERAAIVEHADVRRDGEPILNLSNNNGLIVLRYVCAEGHSTSRAGERCPVCGDYT